MLSVEAKIDALVKGAGSSPLPTAEDAFDLACTLASRGTEGLPHGSRYNHPLQRPYGRTYTTVCTIYPR
jgi:hypothetical protein